MVDIPCPEDWGYSCNPDNITTCKGGYYCQTPGDFVKCPKGFVCAKGSTFPRPCMWWEFCVWDEMQRPHTISSLLYAAFMLSCVSVGLTIAIFLNR